jgi:hypothetical protein
VKKRREEKEKKLPTLRSNVQGMSWQVLGDRVRCCGCSDTPVTLTLQLNYPYDDHSRYEREQSRSILPPSRLHQSVLEPLTAQTRGTPRRNEASTRRDLSAFERRIPPFISRF